ncbi:MAG: amino acid adenylation domain-containing protein [Candidatus Aminicenantes bacterium]|jgi:tyrocidine synthetase-3
MRNSGFNSKLAAACQQKDKEKNYWTNQLALIQPSGFPYDYPGKHKNENTQSLQTAKDCCQFILTGQPFQHLMKLSGYSNNRLYMVLLTGLTLLLEKYTDKQDIGINAPIFKQNKDIAHRLVNTRLIIRNRINPGTTLKELLLAVKQSLLAAIENQAYPLNVLIEQLQLNQLSPGDYTSLFDAAILLENIQDKQYLYAARVNPAMIFSFSKEEQCLKGTLEYKPLLYQKETAQQVMTHFKWLLEIFPHRLDIPVMDIDIVSEKQRKKLVEDFNETAIDFPRDKTLHEVFDQQVEKTPNHIALVGPGFPGKQALHHINQGEFHENITITYKTLNEESHRWANFFGNKIRIQPDKSVGILLDSSIETIIVILGILESGANYLPLETDYPEERLKDIIEDTGVKVIISLKKHLKTLNRLQWECTCFNTYLCLDTRDIRGEQEREKNTLMDKKLWEYLGETAKDEITASGWLSSFTGAPIPKEQMDEYGDNILKKLAPLLHPKMRVLEIGCGSGFTMYRLAPRVGFYYATDLSSAIIRRNQERIKKEGYKNIVLATLPAHEIDGIQEEDFDLVIINSVIQCFPGHNYLGQVIAKAVAKLKTTGFLFIGDIMDQDLKKELIRQLTAFKNANQDKHYSTKIDWSAELFVSRDFFRDLTLDIPGIRQVEFSHKIHTIENELTKFRYDALFTIDKQLKKADKTSIKHKNQLDLQALAHVGSQPLPSKAVPHSLAYIMYTSGSTGKAKGVMVEHRSVVRLVKNTNYITFETIDRLLKTGPLAFDASTFEIWGALLNGLTLYLVDKNTLLTPAALKQTTGKNGITIMWMTAPLFNHMVHLDIDVFAPIKKLLVGGDLLSCTHINRLKQKFPHKKIINGYGPTENTTFSTTFLIDKEYKENIPIGTPIANSTAYILNKNNRLLPLGVPGELLVGGWGLARGYLNNPELTAEKFIPVSFKFYRSHGSYMSYIPKKLYKTGDLARWWHDGNIQFLGRLDAQVKIRGFRVEPGEIHSQLLTHNSIKEAVIVTLESPTSPGLADEHPQDRHCLCCYWTPTAQEAIEESQLKEYLSARLPGYMVPSYFIQVENIPLKPNGKIDTDALPQPHTRAAAIEQSQLPRDPVQKKLAKIWSEILGINQQNIGIHHDFFALGGHSLRATVLVSQIHREFAVKIPLAEVFKTPCIEELARYIKKSRKTSYESIQPKEKKEYYPQSSAQKRLFILDKLENTHTSYNLPYFISLEEKANKERLEKVFLQLIARHESLRTSFITVNDEPVQKIHDEVEFEIEHYDISEVEVKVKVKDGDTEGTRGLVPLPVENFIRPFDLSNAPLLRVVLIHTPPFGHPSQQGNPGGKQFLFLDMHHITTDGTSQSILEKEFMSLYAGEELPPLKLQYKDFSGWQNSPKQQARIKHQDTYWMKAFSNQIPVLQLPTDYPRPEVQSFAGGNVDFTLENRETQTLENISKETDTTFYMVILSIYTILLSKLSGQEDIIVGTPIAARRHADLQPIIGMFVNTLAMRNFPSPGKRYKEFLKEVKMRTLEAYENQEYQFEDLVDKVSVRRDTGRNPIFDVMFNLLNQADYTNAIMQPREGNSLPYRHRKSTAKFDLNLTAFDLGNRFFFNLEYCTSLFKPNTIDKIIGYFSNIIALLKSGNDPELSTLELLNQEEKKEILNYSSGPAQIHPQETIHQWFETQADQTPDHIALVGPSLGTRGLAPLSDAPLPDFLSITYNQLNHQSNQLARFLREQGVKRDTVVGLMLERSIEMIVAILAVLKAGGAYLPISPQYPEQRKKYILQDSQVNLLLTDSEIEKMSYIPGKIRRIDLRVSPKHSGSRSYTSRQGNPYPLTLNSTSNSLIYVIYTSGSTGKPKGVLLEHGNLVNLFRFQYRYTNLGSSRILQFATLSFDASFHEIFTALLSGGTLYLINRETRTNIPTLFEVIKKNVIKTVFLPMSLLKLIFNEDEYIGSIPQCLRHIQTAGEQVIVNDRFREYLKKQGVYLHNHYGPSETHVVTTLTMEPRKDIPELPSIGKPVADTAIYLLDKNQHLVPVGVPGELYIAGSQVGRGYLNKPRLTVEKYIQQVTGASESCKRINIKLLPGVQGDGFLEKSPPGRRRQKLYQSGDLAKWLPDGNIEFLGRIDHQVKIRGFRVEPGEIETRLLNHEALKEAVVTAGEEKNKDKYLCAYIIAECKVRDAELRAFLAKDLPDYMIPSYFVFLESIPLTPSGKIDRKRLPAPGLKGSDEYTAPRTLEEKKLAEIWSEILGIDKETIGIGHNFFELGGHSLKATLMTTKVHKKLNVKLTLTEIFKTPRIRDLAEYIKKSRRDIHEDIQPVERKDYYSQSSAQKRLYILQQMEQESTAYNMPQVIPLSMQPDMKKLEETFIKLIKRHESLRTSFLIINEEPVQKVYEFENVEFKIEHDKEGTRGQAPLPGEPAARSPQSAAALISSFIRPFDLTRAPLLRVGLMKLPHTPAALRVHPSPAAPTTHQGKSPGNRYILMVDMHHIISDGVSHQIMEKDFMAILNGKRLPRLRLQYKDFARWQKKEKETDNLHRQERYWLREFETGIPVLNLPYDFPRPALQSFEGSTEQFEVSADDTGILKSMALEQESTLYMVLLALFNVLLAKLSGQEDVLIGTPVAGRRHADLEKIIGMFVNTLVLRNFPKEEKPFNVFLAEVKKKALQSFENQEYQFEDLVDRVSLNRDTGRNPLFDVMYTLQRPDRNTAVKPSKEIPEKSKAYMKQELYGNQPGISKFDMTFDGMEAGERLIFSVGYCTKLFKKETILRFIKYFKNIVSSILAGPEKQLSEIDILTSKEKQQILYEFNDTTTDYPKNKTIHRLFEEQAAGTPDNIALVGRELGVGTRFIASFSYGELNEKSNQLAHVLQSKGTGPDTIVGIMLERSLEMIIGILGILKAGAAYLPIDPGYPRERINYMLKDSSVNVLLTGQEIADFSSPQAPKIHPKGSPWFGIWNLEFGISPRQGGQLAYVIYTSGSTGRPKGVMVPHRSVVRLVKNSNFIAFSKRDRLLLTGALTFDITTFEIWGSLLNGVSLYVVDETVILDAGKFAETIIKNDITLLHLIPQLFNQITLHTLAIFKGLRYFLVGGDIVKPEYFKGIRTMYPGMNREFKILHMYGPTENTTFSTFYPVDLEKDYYIRIPIGKPIANSTVYVVSNTGALQPVGIPGELVVGGDGVARGYLNQPELTAKKFVLAHSSWLIADRTVKEETADFPMNYELSAISYIYQTGDLARWLPDGNIEFIGRVDYQLKIRGFRIELGEIENRLLNHDAVKEAVVTAREEENQDKYLCAYTVLNREISSRELREYLAGELPDYMIPSYFVSLEKIPLTPNGKIDRKRLPAPELKGIEKYTAPRTSEEKKLAEIWAEVLGIEKNLIGIDHNFFDLGGHSLKASILISRIHKKLDTKLSLDRIFKFPTIRGLSACLPTAARERFTPIKAVEKKEFYELTFNQKRLWYIQQKTPETTSYHMGEVIFLDHRVDIEALQSALKKLSARHESLRTGFEEMKGKPVQFVLEMEDSSLPFQVRDVSDLEEEERKRRTAQIITEVTDPPFDLRKPSLFRAALIKQHTENYLLVYNMHHIISDGWSMEILKKDFNRYYSDYANGKEPGWEPLLLQYKDFARWHNEQIRDPDHKERVYKYWKNKVETGFPLLKLTHHYHSHYIRDNQHNANAGGGWYRCTADQILKERLQRLAKKNQTSLFMVLFSIYNLLMAFLSGQDEVLSAVISAGRQHDSLHPIVGYFINPIIIKTHITLQEDFENLLSRINREVLEVLQYQEYPLELVLDDMKKEFPQVGISFNMLNMQDISTETELDSLTSHHNKIHQDLKFDIALSALEYKNGIDFNWGYRSTIFNPQTMENFAQKYLELMEDLTLDDESKS